MSFSSISFFERKTNRPEIILHLEDLLADLDDKDIALPKKGKFSLGLRDGLLDLLEDGHCARMVEPLPGLELEGLVHPRTCGCLQVQKEEVHIYLIATQSELPNILNVSLALVKKELHGR